MANGKRFTIEERVIILEGMIQACMAEIIGVRERGKRVTDLTPEERGLALDEAEAVFDDLVNVLGEGLGVESAEN